LPIYDQLQILYSTHDGMTFIQLVLLDGGDTGPLNTGGDIVITCWTPGPTQWQTLSYPLPVGTNMIQFNGMSAFGNNLFLDNVMVIPACSGSPNAGAASSASNIVCLSANFNVFLSGADNLPGF